MLNTCLYFVCVCEDYSSGFGGKLKAEAELEKKNQVEHHPSQTSAHRPTTVGKVKIPAFVDSSVDQREENKSNVEPQSVGKIKIPNFVEQQSEKKNTTVFSKGNANSLKSKFENLSKMKEDEAKQKLEEERVKRMETEKREKEQAKLEEQERQTKLKEMQQLSREAQEEKEEEDEDEELASERVERDDEKSSGPFINRIGVSVLPASLAQPKKEEKSFKQESPPKQEAHFEQLAQEGFSHDVGELEQEISKLNVESDSTTQLELKTIQEDLPSEESIVQLVHKAEEAEEAEEQPQSPKAEVRTSLKAVALVMIICC